MKKQFIYFSTLLISVASYGQVGIGTTNPQQTLHIDAAKNTPAGSTTTNVTDDVVVTTVGNVGIGTTAPTTKLEINSKTSGAIKIVDGTQGANKTLVSDDNGVGKWILPSTFKSIVLGTFSNTFLGSDNVGGTKYVGISMNLSPGKWMVNFGGCFKTNPGTIPYWLHAYLSDDLNSKQNTTFSFVGPGGNNTSYAGLMMTNVVPSVGNANLISGSSIIDVSTDTTIYLLVENTNDSTRKWTFSTANWENYFYASPLN